MISPSWSPSIGLQPLYGLLPLLILLQTVLSAATLQPETKTRYESYIKAQERRIEEQNRSSKSFLWTGQKPERLTATQEGQIVVERVAAPDIPDGMIQHWIGAAFFPSTTIEKIKRVDQDYARYKVIYQPDILDSKVLSRNGDHFRVLHRFKREKILTLVIDTVHDIDFVSLEPGRLFVRSRCDNVREVKNPGEPDEQVLSQGEGRGFVWAMNSYWRMEERDGGVFVECEAISLSRSIPFGLGGMIRPAINSFASEALRNTLRDKRKAVERMK